MSYQLHTTVLGRVDFTLPVVGDYHELASASIAAEASAKALDGEALRTTHWAKSQAVRLGELIAHGDVTDAVKVANRVVHRLSGASVPAPAIVLKQLKSLEKILADRRVQLQSTVSQLEARQFEFEVARLLQLMGYGVQVTQATGDDGVDVFARKEGEKVIVQCKRWKKPIGRSPVDELAGTAARHGATHAILATTSSFSTDAVIAAEKHHIVLWDFVTLCGYFQEYGRS